MNCHSSSPVFLPNPVSSPSQLLKSALFLAAALALPSRAEQRIVQWHAAGTDRSEVNVTSCLDRTPNRGFVPVNVSLHNDSGEARTWVVVFRTTYGPPSPGESLMESTFPFPVAARSSARHQVLVPLPTQFDQGRGTTLNATITNGRLSTTGYLPSHDLNTWSTIALSQQSLGNSANLEQLGSRIRAVHSSSVHTSEPLAILTDLALLPPDWRALSGVDVLILTDQDWRTLSPAQRSALRDWVRLGHHLFLLHPAGASVPSDSGLASPGFGSVQAIPWNQPAFPAVEIQSRIASLAPDRIRDLREAYSHSNWRLREQFGFRNFNPWLVMVLLLSFAILVGPVNFFWWAGARQRHRLFFTVPAISAGASVLLIVTIIVQDGFGGAGRRLGVLQIFAAPEDRRACLTQEQISRTGVLTHRVLTAPPAAFLSHVLLNRSRWTFFNVRQDYQARFSLWGTRWKGDWFRSRSEQAHFLQSALPTRGRIERLPSAPDLAPALVSSLGFALDTLYFVDERGHAWRASGPVASGSQIPLQPAPLSEVSLFLKSQAGRFAAFPSSALAGLPQSNRCYGIVENPAGLLLPTHPGVRWKDEPLLLITQPVGRGPASDAP